VLANTNAEIRQFYNISGNCTPFSSVSGDIIEHIIKESAGEGIEGPVKNAVKLFIRDYTYFINKYLGIQHKTKTIAPSAQKPDISKDPATLADFNRTIQKQLDNNSFPELREIIASIKPNYNETKLTIYDETIVMDQLNTAINNFNQKTFVENIMKMNNKLQEIQCRLNKKCCS
jgi:hypothetical protein